PPPRVLRRPRYRPGKQRRVRRGLSPAAPAGIPRAALPGLALLAGVKAGEQGLGVDLLRALSPSLRAQVGRRRDPAGELCLGIKRERPAPIRAPAKTEPAHQ